MLTGTAVHQQAGGALGRHRCGQCEENEGILEKYRKLVDLLYKKVRQLQKKSSIRESDCETPKESHPLARQSTALTEPHQQAENTSKCMQLAFESQKQSREYQMARTRQTFRDDPPRPPRESGLGAIDKLQKVGIVINGLTEQVMRLKSTFMHLRHCVYAFVKELNIGKQMRASPILFNITLALIGIFQFSENEKEEMFNHKKVKMRKRQKGRNKENVFVTIKEI